MCKKRGCRLLPRAHAHTRARATLAESANFFFYVREWALVNKRRRASAKIGSERAAKKWRRGPKMPPSGGDEAAAVRPAKREPFMQATIVASSPLLVSINIKDHDRRLSPLMRTGNAKKRRRAAPRLAAPRRDSPRPSIARAIGQSAPPLFARASNSSCSSSIGASERTDQRECAPIFMRPSD